jgi:hypothetical protein
MGLRLSMAVPAEAPAFRIPWAAHPLVSGGTGDGHVYQGTRRWLNQEFFLLEGRGRSSGWVGERVVGLIGWTADPGARIRTFLSPVGMSEPVEIEDEANFEAGPFFEPPESWPADACKGYRVFLESLGPGRPLPVPASIAETEKQTSLGAPGRSIPSLGLLDGPELLRRADPVPEPSSGSGSSRGCPPLARPVFEGTPGGVTLQGTEVCGVLVIGGDLMMEGKSTFRGLALVGGNLILADQARFEGIARVGGGVSLRGKASLRGSVCPVLRALAEVPALGQPLFPDRGSVRAP